MVYGCKMSNTSAGIIITACIAIFTLTRWKLKRIQTRKVWAGEWIFNNTQIGSSSLKFCVLLCYSSAALIIYSFLQVTLSKVIYRNCNTSQRNLDKIDHLIQWIVFPYLNDFADLYIKKITHTVEEYRQGLNAHCIFGFYLMIWW